MRKYSDQSYLRQFVLAQCSRVPYTGQEMPYAGVCVCHTWGRRCRARGGRPRQQGLGNGSQPGSKQGAAESLLFSAQFLGLDTPGAQSREWCGEVCFLGDARFWQAWQYQPSQWDSEFRGNLCYMRFLSKKNASHLLAALVSQWQEQLYAWDKIILGNCKLRWAVFSLFCMV